MILERIQKENDIKELSDEELKILASEIRQFLIEKISDTGGHLASNLGVIELTMALHLFLDLPKDKLILDLMYIERYSIWQDIMLLLRTLIVFFKSEESTQGFSTSADPAEADVVFVKHEEEIKENAER